MTFLSLFSSLFCSVFSPFIFHKNSLMSVVRPPVVNRTAVKPYHSVCYDNNLVASQGIFLGDNPLTFSLPTLLLEMSIIFLATQAIHYVLQRVGQPRVVSQILTGIILGPSVIGQSAEFRSILFPSRSTFILDTLSNISLILFVFVIGVKTDLSLLRKPGKRAMAIGIASSILPFLLSATIFFTCKGTFTHDLQRTWLILYLAERLSLSSFPVIADALDEIGLLNSNIGRIVMSATLIADMCSWVLNSTITSVKLIIKANSPVMAAGSMLSLIVFVVIVTYVARPLVLRVVKRMPVGELVGEGCFLAIVLSALVAAFITETIGYHPFLGPFMLGLALPGGMPLGVTLSERLESFLLGLFLPLYLVLAGYRTDFTSMRNFAAIGYIELIVFVCYIGKLVGTIGAAMYFKMSMRDAVTMGLMLNIKGIVEVSFFNSWGDDEVATSQHFSVLMVSLLIITGFTTPLIKLLYNPNVRYISSKRRTIQHLKLNHPLRVLACVHNEDNVAPIIDLLEAASPTTQSPFILYVLHLTELAGRAAAVLRSHKKPKNPNANPSPSDRIVNAFRYYENQHPSNAVSLNPFVAISPITTMHNDVCSLALDKKVRLIILPFHKLADGTREMARADLQSLNRNVLDFAPCSVAILVDRGGVTCAHTNHLLQRVVVYFLGGSDDREALSIAMRMAAGGIALTVVRFRMRGEEAVDEEDEELIGELRLKYGELEGVVYVEKLVMDGEGTVGMVRDTSEKFDLVIVGRRRGVESGLTSGLSAWSEYPELGIVGDMLAATEFGGKVSVLVVQQQERVVGEEQQRDGVGERCARGGLGLLGRHGQ